MSTHLFYVLRILAATLITSSGVLRVASLWFRELNEAAVLALVLGGVYLIIGIGLFGLSRFALFMAIIISIASTVLALNVENFAIAAHWQFASIAADIIAACCCAAVLWHVRHNPSV